MKNKLILSLGILFSLLIYLLLYFSHIIEYSDYKVYDNLQTIKNNLFKENVNSSVTIIDIDEKSLHALGQWPWSRLIVSEIISKISKYHPTSIGLDIIFPEEDKTSPNEIIKFYKQMLSKDIKIKGLSDSLNNNDTIFSQTIRNSKVILPIYLSKYRQKNQECNINIKNLNLIDSSKIILKSPNILCNIEVLQNAAANIGFINAGNDNDGIFRRIPLAIKYKDKIIPSFALANMMNVGKLEIDGQKVSILDKTVFISKDNNVLLNFKNSLVKKISVFDILQNNFKTSDITGKFVLIGSSAIGLHDNYQISNQKKINGIEVHSTVINNILNNRIISYSKKYEYLNLFISFILSLFVIYTFVKGIFKNLYIIFSFIVGMFIFNIYSLHNNCYLSFGYFIIPFLINFFLINLVFIFYFLRNKMQLEKEIISAHSNTMESMIAMIQHVDQDTGAHINRTKEYVKLLSTYLYKNNIYKDTVDKRFIEFIYRASPLHDIGKVGIPTNILKKPARLTMEEYEIIKTHSKIGKDIISIAMNENKESNKFLQMAFNITYYHHEKWDGTGYPNKLREEQIPLEARIMAIADVYDALVSKRCYKEAFDFDYSKDLIISCKGTHFDPVLVDAFIELKDEFKQIALDNR